MIFPFLRRIAYTSRKLAIIGNGFDLAHGLKTSYYDFVCAQKEGTFKNYNDFLKRYGNGSQHWYSFEDRIDEISMQCFQCLYDDQYDYNEVLHDTDQINQLFKDIKGHLLKYLRNEVSGRKIKRKLSICKAVRKSTFAINFKEMSKTVGRNCPQTRQTGIKRVWGISRAQKPQRGNRRT